MLYFSTKINQLKIINFKRVGVNIYQKQSYLFQKMVPNIDKYWLLAGPWTEFIHGHVWSFNQLQDTEIMYWCMNIKWLNHWFVITCTDRSHADGLNTSIRTQIIGVTKHVLDQSQWSMMHRAVVHVVMVVICYSRPISVVKVMTSLSTT